MLPQTCISCILSLLQNKGTGTCGPAAFLGNCGGLCSSRAFPYVAQQCQKSLVPLGQGCLGAGSPAAVFQVWKLFFKINSSNTESTHKKNQDVQQEIIIQENEECESCSLHVSLTAVNREKNNLCDSFKTEVTEVLSGSLFCLSL